MPTTSDSALSSEIQMCNNCQPSQPSTEWCENCEAYLCSACANELHKVRVLSKHRRIPVSQRPAPPISCTRHNRKFVQYYRETDSTLLCQDCFLLEHANEMIKPIDTASQIKTDDLEKRISKLQKSLNEYVDSFESYETNSRRTRAIVTKMFRNCRDILKEKENQLLSEIGAVDLKNKTAQDQCMKQVEYIRNSLNKISADLNAILKARNSVKVLENYSELQIRLKQLDEALIGLQLPSCVNLEVHGNDEFQDNMTNLLNEIKMNETEKKTTQRLSYKMPSPIRANEETTIIADLNLPLGIAVDQHDGTVFVVDQMNNGIVSWSPSSNEMHEVVLNLSSPRDVLIDKSTKSIIISEYGNKRILRWSLQEDTTKAEIIIENITCFGLGMDKHGSLYISDVNKNEVRKFPRGAKKGILVAGGNGQGEGNHQLNRPYYITLDEKNALYVSDWGNHRVMKWAEGANQGIVVAGGNGEGSKRNQLNCPNGIAVDKMGKIFIADGGNHRVMCWEKEAKIGTILVGRSSPVDGRKQLKYPHGLYFDTENKLYVVDNENNRVLRFTVGE